MVWSICPLLSLKTIASPKLSGQEQLLPSFLWQLLNILEAHYQVCPLMSACNKLNLVTTVSLFSSLTFAPSHRD